MNKNFLTALIVLGMTVCCSGLYAVAENGYIDVYLTKTREIAPNKAEIVIGVETSNKSAKIATDENKKISNNIQSKIKTLIKEDNGDYIKTSNYSLSPRTIYKDGKSIFDKYVAVNTITVYTKDLNAVSKIVDTAVANGATNINDLNFSISDYDDVCTEMMADLAGKAKARAEKLIAPTGSKVKGVKSMDANCSAQGNYPRVMYSMNKMEAGSAAMDSTPIQKGKVKLNASVNASFFIK